MDQRLDLNSLYLYYRVVGAESITRAAQQLGVPKSTISRKMKLLEHQLGATLLKKGPRKLSTTAIGTVLFDHCRRIATEVEDAGLATSEMQREVRGTLRISMPIDFGISWLSRAIAQFALRYPDIHLEIEVNSEYVDLMEKPYDIAIHLGQLKPSRLSFQRLTTIRRGIYASPGYLSAHGTPRFVEDFQKHDCVVTQQQRLDGVWVLSGPSRHRLVEVTGKVTVNNIGVARELVLGGVGLGVLPNIMCRNDVRHNRLARVLTSWEPPPVQASAVMLNRKGMPRKARVFLEFISAQLAAEDSDASALAEARRA